MRGVWGKAAICALPLISSCSVFSPVPEMPQLPGLSRSSGSPQAAGGNGAPEGDEPCRNSSTDWERNPKCFYGSLAYVVDALERHSASLDERARADINRTAAFNAVVPIAGSILLYRRIRGLPHSSLLFPSAAAAGTHAALSGGVPDIHGHYQDGAKQLRCLSLRYAHLLYRNDEILGDEGRKASLKRIHDDLRIAIDRHGRGRRMLRADLQPVVVKGHTPASAFERSRGTATADVKRDTRDRIQNLLKDREAVAQDTLDTLGALWDQIDGAGANLSLEARLMAPQLIGTLGKAQPPVKDPQSVGSALNSKILAMAQASDRVPDSKVDPDFSQELMDGVQNPPRLNDFVIFQGGELFRAWKEARGFLRNHVEHAQRLKDIHAGAQCQVVPTFTTAPAPAPAPASAGGGSGTGSAAGSGTAGQPANSGGTVVSLRP
jgi:hypothetical protein